MNVTRKAGIVVAVGAMAWVGNSTGFAGDTRDEGATGDEATNADDAARDVVVDDWVRPEKDVRHLENETLFISRGFPNGESFSPADSAFPYAGVAYLSVAPGHQITCTAYKNAQNTHYVVVIDPDGVARNYKDPSGKTVCDYKNTTGRWQVLQLRTSHSYVHRDECSWGKGSVVSCAVGGEGPVVSAGKAANEWMVKPHHETELQMKFREAGNDSSAPFDDIDIRVRVEKIAGEPPN